MKTMENTSPPPGANIMLCAVSKCDLVIKGRDVEVVESVNGRYLISYLSTTIAENGSFVASVSS